MMAADSIIVIEDDVSLRRMLVNFLSSSGFSVAEARDGRDALKLMAEQPARLVITDMLMPGMEGVETICTIHREYPETKIIAVSGGGFNPGKCYLEIAQQLGVEKVLLKPFTPSELRTAVREVMED